jgi:hypothetical protein
MSNSMMLLGVLIGLAGCAANGGSTPPPVTKTIAGIAVTGQPVIVFDHTKDQQEQNNIPDGQVTAWREANGTVNLLIPAFENYRMRGPDLTHVIIDPHAVFSSLASARQVPEDLDNYSHWLQGPYSLDGHTFYSLAHSEWYACLLHNDCARKATNGSSAQLNSWVASTNAFVSRDGGATWQLNVGAGSHIVANPGYHWTGSVALADSIYLRAMNHSGLFQPSRVIHEGAYYYSVAWYLHRDFTKIDPAHGAYQAPVDGYGYVLLRTANLTDPTSWQAWSGGTNFALVGAQPLTPFRPSQNGVALNAAPAQIVYDTTAKTYIMVFTVYGGHFPVYYMTTKTLANPSWSDATAIGGTGNLVTDPAGHITGYTGTNYVSIIDPSSPGYNFEFTGSGSPLLFYSTFPAAYGGNNYARDLYRAQLTVTYATGS